jgi:hypothetical protein
MATKAKVMTTMSETDEDPHRPVPAEELTLDTLKQMVTKSSLTSARYRASKALVKQHPEEFETLLHRELVEVVRLFGYPG